VSSKRYKAIWKQELKNNPHLFKTYILKYHETLYEASDKEISLQRQLNVIHNPLYINMAIRGHAGAWNKGKKLNPLSEEHKAKLKGPRGPRNRKNKFYPKPWAGKNQTGLNHWTKKPQHHLRKRTRKNKLVTCDVCGKSTTPMNIARWHKHNGISYQHKRDKVGRFTSCP
jgi:hypothetical protein